MRKFGASGKGTTDQPVAEAESGARVRRLVYGDLPSVLAIERRSFQTPWSLAMFVLELSKPSGICLCVDTDRGMAGYLICSRYADVWHLMNIAVAPEHRRAGVATELMERLFEQAGPGARFTLEVRTSNAAAIAMYERFGFRPSGHRRRYYHDTGEDALVMWLDPQPVGG
jgi:[ribosomal protein S18]-alanine N-acetyltransferase